MKIGIVTFWRSNDNYGQQLQAFALQRALTKIGHKPFLIRYIEETKAPSKIKFSKIFDYLFHFKAYLFYFFQKRRDKKYSETNNNQLRKFPEFRDTYLNQTSEIYSTDKLILNPPEADVYVCGSDQIWGGDDIYYLSFVPKGKKKLAYAPSFGGVNPFISNRAAHIKALLQEFTFIGVREKEGADLLNVEGIVAEQVADPTLLLDLCDYSILAENGDNSANISFNDAFVYLLGSPIVCKVNEIFDWFRKKGLSYTYVASQGRIDKYHKAPLTIPQWINGIRNAKVVVTNSFHCVVFSLIFHKPFVFIPLAQNFARMNGRLHDLLGSCGLSNQIYSGDFNKIPLSIDFSLFEQYKESCQKQSQIIFEKYIG
ncbi:MAG: polysaccharide pyruvyl transferase family protein [Prevotellaceae bacterium]|nr:polysaccharide pyruvyl transferase family protein [Prevotellaceae bacterium]